MLATTTNGGNSATNASGIPDKSWQPHFVRLETTYVADIIIRPFLYIYV